MLPYINTVAETPPHNFIGCIANAAIDLSKNENKYLYFLVISLGAENAVLGERSMANVRLCVW